MNGRKREEIGSEVHWGKGRQKAMQEWCLAEQGHVWPMGNGWNVHLGRVGLMCSLGKKNRHCTQVIWETAELWQAGDQNTARYRHRQQRSSQ